MLSPVLYLVSNLPSDPYSPEGNVALGVVSGFILGSMLSAYRGLWLPDGAGGRLAAHLGLFLLTASVLFANLAHAWAEQALGRFVTAGLLARPHERQLCVCMVLTTAAAYALNNHLVPHVSPSSSAPC